MDRRPPQPPPRPRPLRLLLLLTLGLVGGGWGLALAWEAVVVQALASSGIQVVTTSLHALPADRLALALLTGGLAPLAALLRIGAVRMIGHAAWPLWLVVLVLFIAENLALSLRLIALATLNLRAAVEASAITRTPPSIDLAMLTMAPWALAGILSGAVLITGLLIVLGMLRDPASV